MLNTVIRRDIQITTVTEEIRHYGSQYSAHLSVHPNDLVVNLMAQPDIWRLRRDLSNDLQKTAFFIATAVNTSDLTCSVSLGLLGCYSSLAD
jgi:hypothetical protein